MNAANWFHRMRRGEAPAPPVAGLLGEAIHQVDLQRGQLHAAFEAAPDFLNPAGHVQGGMLAAMLDALTAGLAMATVEEDEAVVTLSLGLQFLRPAAPGLLEGSARLVLRGRKICHVDGELRQGGKAVAMAYATIKVVPAGRS